MLRRNMHLRDKYGLWNKILFNSFVNDTILWFCRKFYTNALSTAKCNSGYKLNMNWSESGEVDSLKGATQRRLSWQQATIT